MSKEKLLIVDDDETALIVCKKELEDAGFDVTTSTSGEDAVQLIKDQDYAVVVTDLMLPAINGVLICQAAKQKNSDTEVVLMSAFQERMENHQENFWRAGGRLEILKKPLNHGQLSEIVNKVLGRTEA